MSEEKDLGESVGEKFQLDLLKRARSKALDCLMEAAGKIKPGMTEEEARKIALDTLAAHGAGKSWHTPQIRFGENTVLSFGVPGKEGVRLQENDIFFFDFGPIFSDHEGDIGRPFAIGNDPDHHRCCEDAKAIWNETRRQWKTKKTTGVELYEFAAKRAEQRGWKLSLTDAGGHRISDFPHVAKARSSIDGNALVPAPNRWILEIQIRHPEKPFGAFYEDLLD